MTFVSCSKQKIIPEKTLTEIIYRMYISDAVLNRDIYIPHKDSVRIYEPIIEKFGYSLDDLRITFLKYTTENGKLQAILKEVSQKIETEKNIYKIPARIEKLSENMNVGVDSISLVSKTLTKHNIEIRLSEQGVYDVSASYFFYQNDSTQNPKMTAWLESRLNRDSVICKQEINLLKDSVFNDYSISMKFSDPDFNILKIYWLDFDNKLETQKPEIRPSVSRTPSKKKVSAKIKPDTTTRLHLIIKDKSVKYNFEKSDTTKLMEQYEFVGPPPFDSLDIQVN
jgi:hypothetical protein